MYRIILGLVLCLSVSTYAVIQDCGSKVGKYNNVTVSDCEPDAATCILKRGTDASITISFDVDKDISAVKAVVHGVIGGAPLPFPFSHPDGCQTSGLTCPLTKASGPYTYTTTLHVEKLYPKLKVGVKWELKDENDDNIVCAMIPSEIK
ncbi:NPC intracellular cholesterol transporter 2 homolog a [Microplitis demolitor]|uniref:NPC intracellular cholesterol transporter 2 homolog a n=1 Tax=Microplitis demolitor TaxID=69319 RepID=UPI0004CD1D72|nr:NPC intracellular cholesterol transporter 2 homolog a [Microplitis demolitor]